MNKILVGIPVLSGAEHTKLAIDSVVSQADVLVIDNNSDYQTKLVLLREDIGLVENDTNEYVNPSWNTILRTFLLTDYETLIIMNSDLIMQPRWSEKLDPFQICIPTDGSHAKDVVVTEGTPGVFIHLSRRMAEIAYPIPAYIKIWFGDLFIFSVLRKLGYKTVVKAGLVGLHYNGGSQSVNIVPDKVAIIEVDKIEWDKFGEIDIQERVWKWSE